jgi:DNA polymerase I-like protein with 3'-5' exonuclease and polymerase domains
MQNQTNDIVYVSSEGEMLIYDSLLRLLKVRDKFTIIVHPQSLRTDNSTVFVVKELFEKFYGSRTEDKVYSQGRVYVKIPNSNVFFDSDKNGYALYLQTGLKMISSLLSPPLELPYRVILSVEEFENWLHQNNQDIFLDIETRGTSAYTDQSRIAALGLYREGEPETIIVPLDHIEYKVPFIQQKLFYDVLKTFVSKNSIGLIGHNLKFDLRYLSVIFNDRTLIDHYRADTMFMAYVNHGKMFTLSLSDCVAFYTRHRTHKDEVKEYLRTYHSKGQGNYDLVPERILFPYLSSDVYATSVLYKELLSRLETKDPQTWTFYQELIQPLLKVLLNIELNGNKIDVNVAYSLKEELNLGLTQLVTLFKYKYLVTEDVISSPKKLSVFLQKMLKDKGVSVTSTSEKSLKELKDKLADPVLVDYVLEYRSKKKKLETYVENFIRLVDKEGYIHPYYHPQGTLTGRLSSSDPNFQNIPFKDPIKKCVVSSFGEDGVLIQSDYKGAELRVLANLSKDPSLIEDLTDPSKDLHTINASAMFKTPIEKVDSFLRKRAKNAFFALIYGSTEHGLARQLECPVEEAKSIIDNFYKHRTEVGKLDKSLRKDFLNSRNTFVLRNPVGRKILPMLSLHLKKETFKDTSRKLLNYLIQSTSSDFCLLGLIELHRRMKDLNLRSQIVNTVHDSIIVDTHIEEIPIVITLLRACQVEYINKKFNLELPLDNELEIGPNWYNMVECSYDKEHNILKVVKDDSLLTDTFFVSNLVRFGYVLSSVSDDEVTFNVPTPVSI